MHPVVQYRYSSLFRRQVEPRGCGPSGGETQRRLHSPLPGDARGRHQEDGHPAPVQHDMSG